MTLSNIGSRVARLEAAAAPPATPKAGVRLILPDGLSDAEAETWLAERMAEHPPGTCFVVRRIIACGERAA